MMEQPNSTDEEIRNNLTGTVAVSTAVLYLNTGEPTKKNSENTGNEDKGQPKSSEETSIAEEIQELEARTNLPYPKIVIEIEKFDEKPNLLRIAEIASNKTNMDSKEIATALKKHLDNITNTKLYSNHTSIPLRVNPTSQLYFEHGKYENYILNVKEYPELKILEKYIANLISIIDYLAGSSAKKENRANQKPVSEEDIVNTEPLKSGELESTWHETFDFSGIKNPTIKTFLDIAHKHVNTYL